MIPLLTPVIFRETVPLRLNCVGGMGPENIEALNTMTLEEMLTSLNISMGADFILSLLEIFLEVPPGILVKNNTVGQVLHDWLDIDLSISEGSVCNMGWLQNARHFYLLENF